MEYKKEKDKVEEKLQQHIQKSNDVTDALKKMLVELEKQRKKKKKSKSK